jgi:hypothetical protein
MHPAKPAMKNSKALAAISINHLLEFIIHGCFHLPLPSQQVI